MVGGYSECSLLQDAIRNIAGDIRVIIPNDPGLAVLKGAVINGHHPEMVSQRICKYTYGVGAMSLFIEGVHREDYRVTQENGDIRCENCFSSFVTRGTHVHFGTSSVTKSFSVISSNQTSISFGIYASTSDNPMYTTDDSVQEIGELVLDMPDTSRGLDRGAKVTMYFGGSEIEVKAVDKHSGNEIRVRVDFLG
ncbi:heat shock 70 kDa protein 12A-like [Pecten maximus]|uniref:heat shock 70 kDa protein 12A-like n=1 Tax=Pecten maximus TaxID=6579 RepID=UPI0014588ABF|nr:heat shock 70 kDa protein 12A-like [Pecten maximus]